MQVTIDSNEPLERVLRVVGALYDVQLSIAGAAESSPEAAAQPAETAARPQRRGARRETAPSASRRGPRRAAALDMGAARRWARENGFQVSDRGPVSRNILDAYTASGNAGQ